MSGRKRTGTVRFAMMGKLFEAAKSIKYLGVIVDKNLTFMEHIKAATIKAEQKINQLSWLLPNTKGAKEQKRRLLFSTAQSIVMYGAEIWTYGLRHKKNRDAINRVQRKAALRIISAYCTVSAPASMVLASTVPMVLLAEEYKRPKAEGDRKARAMEAWQTEWDRETRGRWTHQLIPRIKEWVNRKEGQLDYFSTQCFTGHGAFGQYLHRIGKRDSSECKYCESGMIDDANHTMFLCNRWNEIRKEAENIVGVNLTCGNLVNVMMECETNWEACSNMMRKIIQQKEADDNQRDG